ncbi:outer membrane beta-barrel protein [Pontibacter burrus]|uniref:Porin family protein n=1 Tax=Pontibacter burrus TaxID=2704466 RepID=A0A6B3LGW9_9BACT|nr:outer membrane beta-barrel protein [Pontibacter burrus]NEM96292.1 porin family protein [Pontibacter burrus]
MKTLSLFLLLSLYTLAAIAQVNPDTAARTSKHFYVGLGLTTITYHIYYDEQEKLGDSKTGYFTPVTLHVSYAITDRLNIQAGIGYGGSKAKREWSPNHNPNDPVKYKDRSVTHVLSVPVSAKFIFFKALRRFPVYGTFTLMPSFGFSKAESEEITDTNTTTTVVKVNDMNVFATGGLGFNYKISNRFTGYAEYLFYKHNLTGQNSFDYDWEQASTIGRRIFKSLAIGVNYSL